MSNEQIVVNSIPDFFVALVEFKPFLYLTLVFMALLIGIAIGRRSRGVENGE